MSFFKDFKDDLSQAVNELMPEGTEEANDDIQMVDTLTEDTDTSSEPSIEDMLKNIENIGMDVAEEEEVSEVHEEILEEIEINQDEPLIEQEIEEAMTSSQDELVDEDAPSDENGIITEGMTINGDIVTKGSIEVIGSVNGNLDIKGKLVVTGMIQGNSKAAEVFADSAKVIGEVVSMGSVKIGQSSIVIGNITAKSAVLAGAVKGDIDVQGPVILDTTAIIMGNIKSRSIQINNGAVIEGLCSQCYAEVSPAVFFEDEKVKKAKK